jgi:hypothetical protein
MVVKVPYGRNKRGTPLAMWDTLNHAVVPAVNVAKCCRREAWVRPGNVVTGDAPVRNGH